MQKQKKREGGFTLVELTVVIVIIGILAAFAVPRFLDSAERSRAAEAFNYLSSVVSAQERFHARQGKYATKMSDLDIDMDNPTYFKVHKISAGKTRRITTSWRLTLRRKGASGGYGAYTVSFTQNGFDTNRKYSTIMKHKAINPMQTK